MHTHKLLTCLAAATIVASACVSEVKDPNEGMEEITLELLNSIPDDGGELFGPDTRTTFDESVTTGWATLWSPREYIGVYGNRTKNARFRSTNNEDAAAPSFKGSVYWGDTPKYTYYPYSADNRSVAYTAVKQTLPTEQSFNTQERVIAYDFKIGSVTTSGSGWRKSYTFNWDAMPLTFVRIKINATGTALEGEKIQSITMTAPEGRRLAGNFTANLSTHALTWTTDADGYNSIVLSYPDTPELSADETLTSYLTCAPMGVQNGDVLNFVIRTNKHVVKTTKTIPRDYEANRMYGLTFNLASMDLEVEGIPVENLDFESFGFAVSDNAGKIFGQELYYNSDYNLGNSVYGATDHRSIDMKSLTVDTENKTIEGCIPYLYDFTLIPTFTLTNDDAKVLVDGKEIISGKTPVTFTNGEPVVFELATDAGSNYYDVIVSNTGLPIVVLTSNGSASETVNWRQTGLTVNAKRADWTENDILNIYNADGSISAQDLTCGFRLRGNSTRKYPKKPFAIKLADKANLLDIMPSGSHKRWCLLANWGDHSMMRNALTFAAANRTIDAWKNAGIDPGLIWNPSGKNVELVIDGVHVGNYLLCEQIKISGKRLDINDAYEDVVEDGNSNPALDDCGYLMEFDDNYDENYKFYTTYRSLPCMFKDDINNSLLSEIKTKVNNIESYLVNGNYDAAFKLLDIYSVIDWWFIHELAMNKEYRHPKSVYMYMNGDSKLFAGPVWDFDYQTYPNVSNVNSIHAAAGQSGFGYGVSEWLYGGSNSSDPYMWYPLLFKSATFREAVQARWEVMGPALRAAVNDIASMGQANMKSWAYNFAMWPIESGERQRRYVYNLPDVQEMGIQYDTWFIEYCGDERLTTYQEVVNNLQSVYLERLNEMDAMISNGDFVTNAN